MTLVGVGSSICGGSAIAATAPVIDADDEEVAQAISVIFIYNVLAAILFPTLGKVLGFSITSGDAFGIFAGTATLDKAVTVKLTRTLAIISITLVLALYRSRKESSEGQKVSLKKIFPFFILYCVGYGCYWIEY